MFHRLGRILSLSWSEDEALITTGMSDGYVRIFNVATGAPSLTGPRSRDRPVCALSSHVLPSTPIPHGTHPPGRSVHRMTCPAPALPTARSTGSGKARGKRPTPPSNAPLVWAVSFLRYVTASNPGDSSPLALTHLLQSPITSGANVGLIVSGDSTGNVCVWDSVTGTLVQAVATHDADILTVVASEVRCHRPCPALRLLQILIHCFVLS